MPIRFPTMEELDAGYAEQCAEDWRRAHGQPVKGPMNDAEAELRAAGIILPDPESIERRGSLTVDVLREPTPHPAPDATPPAPASLGAPAKTRVYCDVAQCGRVLTYPSRAIALAQLGLHKRRAHGIGSPRGIKAELMREQQKIKGRLAHGKMSRTEAIAAVAAEMSQPAEATTPDPGG